MYECGDCAYIYGGCVCKNDDATPVLGMCTLEGVTYVDAGSDAYITGSGSYVAGGCSCRTGCGACVTNGSAYIPSGGAHLAGG